MAKATLVFNAENITMLSFETNKQAKKHMKQIKKLGLEHVTFKNGTDTILLVFSELPEIDFKVE